MQYCRYIRPIRHKSCNYSTIGSIYTNFITSKIGSQSNITEINSLFRQSNLEPWECINILQEIYKNKCKFELTVLQRAEFYNICNDLITGGLQNPLPLKSFITDPINTYFDVKFSYNRINTLLSNQIDTNSPILLKHSTNKDSNIYLFPKDGIETVGSLNNAIRFENPYNDENNDDKSNLNLNYFLQSIFNKSEPTELVNIFRYLYLMDLPLNLSILNNLSEIFISKIHHLTPIQISETAYIFSSYLNDIDVPNITNSLSYHSQYFIYNLYEYKDIIPSLYLLYYSKGEKIYIKSIINKLISQNYIPENFRNNVMYQIILSLLDMNNDSLSKKISQEINNQIINDFDTITEPDLIYVAKMISHNYSKSLCDKLFDFVFENLSDLHVDTVSAIYLYLSKNKSVCSDNNIINKLLLHINNNVGTLSGGLIPDIYVHSIRRSLISDNVMKIYEKNISLNKKYLTSRDISNMSMAITFHGKDQKNVIKILLEQFIHLKKHDRSKPEETLDNILAFSLAGVKHPELWDNINLPIILNTVSNNLLVYIAYSFLITEFKCNICWSIIVERLLYENVQHSADIFKVLKIAQIMNYIHLITDGTTVNSTSSVILDKATIQKFNNTIIECKQINLNKLNTSKIGDDLQKYNELLLHMDIPFEINYIIEDLYLVSFYLPTQKIVIDIINDNDTKITGNINGELLLKHKVIKSKGYNLIVIKNDWIDRHRNINIRGKIQLFYRKLGIKPTPKNIIKNK